MSKTSNNQKIAVLKIWLEEQKRKGRIKKKNPNWLKEILNED
jgi:hypothetical protein